MSTDFVLSFPLELTLHIFSFLQANDLRCLSFVSKHWQAYSSYDVLWRSLCERDFVSLESNKAKRKKRETKIKDHEEPKKNLSSYLFYCQEQRPLVKKQMPTLSFGELQRTLGKYWRELPAEEKKIYQTKAKEDKIRYDAEMDVYLKKKSTQNPTGEGYKLHYKKKILEQVEERKLSMEEAERKKAIKRRRIMNNASIWAKLQQQLEYYNSLPSDSSDSDEDDYQMCSCFGFHPFSNFDSSDDSSDFFDSSSDDDIILSRDNFLLGSVSHHENPISNCNDAPKDVTSSNPKEPNENEAKQQ